MLLTPCVTDGDLCARSQATGGGEQWYGKHAPFVSSEPLQEMQRLIYLTNNAPNARDKVGKNRQIQLVPSCH